MKGEMFFTVNPLIRYTFVLIGKNIWPYML